MCGVLYAHDNFLNEKSFKKSLDIIKHRGPDYQSFNLIDKYSILGHVRLSIIDCTEILINPLNIIIIKFLLMVRFIII